MLKLSSQGKTDPPLKQATIVVNEVTHSMRMSGQCPGGLKFVCFRFIKYSLDPCALVVSPATLKDTICNEVDHWSKPMLHFLASAYFFSAAAFSAAAVSKAYFESINSLMLKIFSPSNRKIHKASFLNGLPVTAVFPSEVTW
jgi:hypothetical protein